MKENRENDMVNLNDISHAKNIEHTKKPYDTPKLEKFGSVASMTTGGTRGGSDASSSSGMME